MKWEPNGSYGSIVMQYARYVLKSFGPSAIIVFDGYCNGPTTKDHEHARRAVKVAPYIAVELNQPSHNNMSEFLANEKNKKQLVNILTEQFEREGLVVFQAADDADTLIVKKSLDLAREKVPVVTVANDTDVLLLLLYHFEESLADVFLRSDTNSGPSATTSIRSVRSAIGDVAAQQLLVIHAIGGCDTTSAIYGHSKVTIYKKLTKSKAAVSLCSIIGGSNVSHCEVDAAGAELLNIIYGLKSNDKLNHYRYSSCLNLLSTCTSQPRPERLPPTENAAKYHLYRVHLQVAQWRTLMACDLKPDDWGWKIVQDRYVPIATDLPAAPRDILKIIRCQCRATGRSCRTQLCSCVKHGLACVAACKHCSDGQCCNQEVLMSSTVESAYEDLTPINDTLLDDCSMEFFIPWVTEEVIESTEHDSFMSMSEECLRVGT
jgi:hypothetical protein